MEETLHVCFHRLYEPTKTQMFVQKESALGWCRHVLDNPTPEMEAACRVLMNKLDPSRTEAQMHHTHVVDFQKTFDGVLSSFPLSLWAESRCYFYRRTAASSHVPSVSAGSSVDRTSDSTSLNDSDSYGNVIMTALQTYFHTKILKYVETHTVTDI